MFHLYPELFLFSTLIPVQGDLTDKFLKLFCSNLKKPELLFSYKKMIKMSCKEKIKGKVAKR